MRLVYPRNKKKPPRRIRRIPKPDAKPFLLRTKLYHKLLDIKRLVILMVILVQICL